jgi:type I restriction enzyme M protein
VVVSCPRFTSRRLRFKSADVDLEWNMSSKRQILEALTRDELQAAVDNLGLTVADRRVKDQLINALAGSHRARLVDILGPLSRDRLKEICRRAGLDDGGREKSLLIERLTGVAPVASAGVQPNETIEAPPPAPVSDFAGITSFIWSIAELLRGDYKQADYGKVIMPLTVLRRIDCVLCDTKDKVLKKYESLKGGQIKNLEPILNRITGVPFHNTSRLDFPKLLNDPDHIAANLRSYINGFSENARDIVERFNFDAQIAKLDEANLLYQVMSRFVPAAHSNGASAADGIDLHPSVVPNHVMGSIFEELIRRFSEQSNETAGEHFTPREVIRLMVNLLFVEDAEILTKPGIVKTLYDPACGTGGMLSVAEEYLRELNPEARLEVFGQELNDETYAVCKADMMIKGQNPENIKRGNSFSEDGHGGSKFDYMLSNPPFGVEWKKVEKTIRDEAERGHAGRFGAGLPRINDGSLLFLQHMISKMKPEGSRIAIVFNGSPLFTGDAGSGESEIRRWIVENDWLEAIVALPDQLFYNTGISTYIWIVTNRKPLRRKGKVQLIDASGFAEKMRRALGEKRNELPTDKIEEITRIYGDATENAHSKIFENEDFAYRRIVVERPLRLRFQITQEGLARLQSDPAFRNCGTRGNRNDSHAQELQKEILAGLVTLDATAVYRSRTAFEAAVDSVFSPSRTRMSGPIRKAIVTAFGDRDASADVCRNAKGEIEADPDLRDHECVPIKQDVREFFDREVRPLATDAWIDESKTKIGYEIPFSRHFFTTQDSRPIDLIRQEIRELETRISALVKEILE